MLAERQNKKYNRIERVTGDIQRGRGIRTENGPQRLQRRIIVSVEQKVNGEGSVNAIRQSDTFSGDDLRLIPDKRLHSSQDFC